MSDENKQEDNQATSNNKLIYITSGCSLCIYLLLLLWTEIITDATVTYHMFILILTLLFVFAPLILIFFPIKKFTKIISIGCTIITLILSIYLFWFRNKVTIVWITEGWMPKNQDHVIKSLQDKISPAGVVLLVGNKFSIPDSKKLKGFNLSEKLEKYEHKEKPEGEKPEGEKPEGENTEGENTEGENTEGEKPEGEKAEGEKADEEEVKDSDMPKIFETLVKNSENRDNKNVKSFNQISQFKLQKCRFSGIIPPKKIVNLQVADFSPKEIMTDPEYRKKHGIMDITDFDEKDEK